MNSKPLKVLVVEDEPLVMQTLCDKLEEHPQMTVCGNAHSVDTAFKEIIKKQPDAIFLDINIVGGDGFKLLEELREANQKIPPVVLNTGFEKFEYAQLAFNEYKEEIVHILKKPFFDDWENKREACLEAILNGHSKEADRAEAVEYSISLRIRDETHIIRVDQLLYIEVYGDGSIIVVTTDGRNLIVGQTMASLLQVLPKKILQVSRHNSVNLDYVVKLKHSPPPKVIVGKQEKAIKIGQTFLPKVKLALGS